MFYSKSNGDNKQGQRGKTMRCTFIVNAQHSRWNTLILELHAEEFIKQLDEDEPSGTKW